MKFSCQQDGKVGSPNTHLPNRNNKSNKQLQLRKQQKSYRAQKLKTATQKIGSISPAWPHSPVQNSSAWKGIPSKGFHPMGKKKKKKNRRTPASLITTLDICSLCYHGSHSLLQCWTQLTELLWVLAAPPLQGWSCHWGARPVSRAPVAVMPHSLELGHHNALPSMGLELPLFCPLYPESQDTVLTHHYWGHAFAAWCSTLGSWVGVSS